MCQRVGHNLVALFVAATNSALRDALSHKRDFRATNSFRVGAHTLTHARMPTCTDVPSHRQKELHADSTRVLQLVSGKMICRKGGREK